MNNSTFKYNTSKANWHTFKETLHTLMTNHNILEVNISSLTPDQLDKFVHSLTNTINSACLNSFALKTGLRKPQASWWSENLEHLKKQCINLHHKIHTHSKNKQTPPADLINKYHEIKFRYTQTIRKTSTEHFKQFCESQGAEDVWSITNKLLKYNNIQPSTLKVNNKFTSNEEETSQALLTHFYPDVPDTDVKHTNMRNNSSLLPDTEDDPAFTSPEIISAFNFICHNKAPGNDHLTSDICQVFTRNYPELTTNLMNHCLQIAHFPTPWKEAVVKIIPKPNKQDYTNLNSFRPIGQIPVFGKVLEKLFTKRFTYNAHKLKLLNRSQFGFTEQTTER
ncbi:unnamed protein product [Pieris macdunnoughi]|nr:unnamed protein product [Pieris macdunnoughi]